jgi:hypothetical protein
MKGSLKTLIKSGFKFIAGPEEIVGDDMKSAAIFFLLSTFFFLNSGVGYAEPVSIEKISKQLETLESRMQKIEGHQKEILARQDKVLAELDRLRIWVHRR